MRHSGIISFKPQSEEVIYMERTSYAERKQYGCPDEFGDLQGPVSGVITLPHHLWWWGERSFDMADENDRASVYVSVLNEGSTEEVCRYVNGPELQRLWSTILLPRKLVREYQSKFHELTGNIMGGSRNG